MQVSTSMHTGARVGTTLRLPASTSSVRPLPCRSRVVVRATGDPDAELEERLAKLRASKGATPYGQGVKATKAGYNKPEPEAKGTSAGTKQTYDYTGETLYYEGNGATADLLINLALGTTLVWLPLTFAALGRTVFVKYRFTDRRLSVQSTAPWKNEQTDVAYQEVKDVITVSRGFGLFGDMVVTLRDNSKVELRSLDKYQDLKQYILKRRDELAPAGSSPSSSSSASSKPVGRELSQAELLGEEAKPTGSKKGFW